MDDNLCSTRILVALVIVLFSSVAHSAIGPIIRIDDSAGTIFLSNGILNLTFSFKGDLNVLSYGEMQNVFFERESEDDIGPKGGKKGDRGYYDCHAGIDDVEGVSQERFKANSWQVETNTSSRITISFRRNFNCSNPRIALPGHVDTYFSLPRGVSGFYSWLVVRREKKMPSGALGELRYVLKLNPKLFPFTYVGEKRYRRMPEWFDLDSERSDSTEVPEARLLVKPSNTSFKGEFDHKYHYLSAQKDQLIHGWISNTTFKHGIWVVSPHKSEYGAGGPTKQDLTVQTSGILLNHLFSTHVGTPPLVYQKGEKYKKMYGPWFLLLNRAESKSDNLDDLWYDAKKTAQKKNRLWPLEFFTSNQGEGDYPSRLFRGTVTGQITIDDKFLDLSKVKLDKAWVGLVNTSQLGQWSHFSDGYQYWANPLKNGTFYIPFVRQGNHFLHVFVPGVFGDFVIPKAIEIKPGKNVNLGLVTLRPPRIGKTLWEIGIPDRDSREFYIPVLNQDCRYPYPSWSPDRFRNYGVWTKYNEQFKSKDLSFIANECDWTKEWWFVQPSRIENGKYKPTTWSVKFSLNSSNLIPAGYGMSRYFVLRVALSAITSATLQINLNSLKSKPIFDSSTCGCTNYTYDNAMFRATTYGIYISFSVPIPGSMFSNGDNTLFFTQARPGRLSNVMFDYIRLEEPEFDPSIPKMGFSLAKPCHTSVEARDLDARRKWSKLMDKLD